MKQKFSVVIVSPRGLEGEVYEFSSAKEAQEFANARKELYEMLYKDSSIFMKAQRPRIYISSLCQLKKKKRQKDNEINEWMTSEILRKMKKTYKRRIRQKNFGYGADIVRCYEQAELVNHLYSYLVEEDDDRLREEVQNLADSIMNEEVMPVLSEIGYVF